MCKSIWNENYLLSIEIELSEDLEDGAKYFSDINSMMPECDFVSIHTPATAETKHILNATTNRLITKTCCRL